MRGTTAGEERRPVRGGDRSGGPPGDPERDLTHRVLSRDEAVERYGPRRATRLVFTNGCFDLLHRGHIALLARAGSLGDRLLVGLNSDRSVRRLKGPGRPLMPAEDRALLLAALRFVDAVTVFDEPTPLPLVRALRPDVLVKGADYRRDDVVGGDEVEGWGGRVVLVPLVAARSTSGLLDRLGGGAIGEGGGGRKGSPEP